MNNSYAPIGVFDSGCGGLTVLKMLQHTFPHENFVYFADTAHLPYGTKSPEEIKQYTYTALQWLQNIAQVKLIVVACHTSSAIAVETIKNSFCIPIIDTIYPLAKEIIENNNYKNIGIIATPVSVQSRMHEQLLRVHGFTGIIQSIACPSFVPLIEASEIDIHTISSVAQEYLYPFHSLPLDTLVYGCTHYPLIAPIIQPLLPPTMQYLDPAYAIAKTVNQYIQNQATTTKIVRSSTQYFCTSNPLLFSAKIAHIMKISETAKLISINC